MDLFLHLFKSLCIGFLGFLICIIVFGLFLVKYSKPRGAEEERATGCMVMLVSLIVGLITFLFAL